MYKTSAFDAEDTPILCKIHDAFGGLDGDDHNCLGCNFADSQTMIEHYLAKYDSYTDVRESMTLYFIILYLLVERMETVMDMVQVPDAYREKHFKVFQQIRKWSNFIKHPKAFILTHHPHYDFDNSGVDFEVDFKVVINDQFVTEYYKGESTPENQKKKNRELATKLHNKRDVHVVFPDIAKLTQKLCYSINRFSELITRNEVYIDILNDKATIFNYFENQNEDVIE